MYSVVLPNPNLKPEESINVELGVNGDYKSLFGESDRFVFHANVFRRSGEKNLINAGATGDMDFSPDGDMILYYSIKTLERHLKLDLKLLLIITREMRISTCLTATSMRKIRIRGKKIPGLTPMQATLRAGYTYKPWDLNGWYRLRLYKGGESNIETSWGSGEYKKFSGFATHAVGFNLETAFERSG